MWMVGYRTTTPAGSFARDLNNPTTLVLRLEVDVNEKIDDVWDLLERYLSLTPVEVRRHSPGVIGNFKLSRWTPQG